MCTTVQHFTSDISRRQTGTTRGWIHWHAVDNRPQIRQIVSHQVRSYDVGMCRSQSATSFGLAYCTIKDRMCHTDTLWWRHCHSFLQRHVAGDQPERLSYHLLIMILYKTSKQNIDAYACCHTQGTGGEWCKAFVLVLIRNPIYRQEVCYTDMLRISVLFSR